MSPHSKILATPLPLCHVNVIIPFLWDRGISQHNRTVGMYFWRYFTVIGSFSSQIWNLIFLLNKRLEGFWVLDGSFCCCWPKKWLLQFSRVPFLIWFFITFKIGDVKYHFRYVFIARRCSQKFLSCFTMCLFISFLIEVYTKYRNLYFVRESKHRLL